MSHTTAIKAIKIQSIDVLRAALEELNEKGIKCSLLENAEPRHYYTSMGRAQEGMGRAPYVIKMENSKYDIGLYDSGDGGYEARTDFWGGDIEKLLGGNPHIPENMAQAKMGKLFQTYGIHAAMQKARSQGMMVRRVNNEETGEVKLLVTGF